jgi:hypothetical protein
VTAPSVRTELAAAFRQVAADFNRLPAKTQAMIDFDWSSADELLDRRLLDGDRDDALRAISEWKAHYLALFEEVV